MITEKLRLPGDRLLSRQQLASCPSHSGIPLLGGQIRVYSHVDVERQPLTLTGHRGEITAMTFGKGSSPPLLCSASSYYVIVWDIELCQRRRREGKVATGTVIGTLLGEVVHLSFCRGDERVAACSGATAYILHSQKQEVISSLTGHLGPLTSAEFCPWNPDMLVTASEDRTFKVWDLQTESIFYHSFVLAAAPLLSVFFLEGNKHILTGSTEGQVWCFSLQDDIKCQLVTKIDLQKMEKRYQAGVTERSAVDDVETSKPVLLMAPCCSFNESSSQKEKKNSWFCVGSTDGLYVVDLAASELLTVLYFKGMLPCDLRRIRAGGEGLSVLPSSPPLLESPLNVVLQRKEANHSKKTGALREHPLVFHSKLKSSGYTSSPTRVMFTPRTNAQKSQTSTKAKEKTGLLLREYPGGSAAPSVLHTHLGVSNKPVYCLQYSGNGKQILCGLGDNSVLLHKSSLAGRPAVYTGHDKLVSSVSWSLSRQCWLSASEDQTLRIWTHGTSVPALVLGKSTFSRAIRRAQFYYLDKFVLLASGNSLHLYLYDVDISHDDIKRYQQRSVVKRVGSFATTSGTDISDMSAINDFLSYMVLVGGADRSIQVFDMNKGQVAAVLPDAHSRAVHCITQNKGSAFSTQTPDSYNLFLTSAVTDAVKIWDLRTLRCVRRYENHLNRCHPCSAAISPCGQFLASGSEDNCAYVYDIRSSSFLHKLEKHSETVLSVAFNPATPELLTGTLDGKLGLFQSTSGV
ncbi:WD repeat-containing protein 27 [Aulostomus maculatus]